MSLLRRALCTLWCACALACGAAPPPASSGEASEAIEADTELACSRTRSAGAWTQLVFRSATWRDLAARADRRDPRAWEEIGDRIEHNLESVDGSACTEEMLENVRASAARLAGAR